MRRPAKGDDIMGSCKRNLRHCVMPSGDYGVRSACSFAGRPPHALRTMSWYGCAVVYRLFVWGTGVQVPEDIAALQAIVTTSTNELAVVRRQLVDQLLNLFPIKASTGWQAHAVIVLRWMDRATHRHAGIRRSVCCGVYTARIRVLVE